MGMGRQRCRGHVRREMKKLWVNGACVRRECRCNAPSVAAKNGNKRIVGLLLEERMRKKERVERGLVKEAVHEVGREQER